MQSPESTQDTVKSTARWDCLSFSELPGSELTA
jgi:hypothetical protein